MKNTIYLLVFICFLGNNYVKAQTYCISGLYSNGCTGDDFFSSLTFGSINQTGITCSSGTAGYNDFTSVTTNFVKGGTYSIYGVTVYGSDENVIIWIDYNDDGIFDNTTELLYSSPTSFATLSDNITIPLSAILGTHRMRVRLAWGTTYFDACTLEDWGCVNDYTVTIQAAQPCAGTPTPGNTISTASSVCPNINFILGLENNVFQLGLTYQWQSSPNNSTWTNIQSATYDTLTTSQTVSTYYRCKVGCAYGSSIAYSNPIYINMNALASCYCIPSASYYSCTSWISNITTIGGVSNFNNSSVCAPSSYADYSSTYNASNVQLATTSMSLTSNDGSLAFSVWIDFNDNGIFEPSERVIANSNQNYLLTVTDSFAIPITAAPGSHRMRIRGETSWYETPTDPCSQLYYGETEDYAFTVIAAPPCAGTPNPGNTISTVSSVCSGNMFSLSLQNNVIASGFTYQWQYSTNDSVWTNIYGSIYDTLITTQTVASYYRCLISCSNGSSTAISNPAYVTINLPATCYCTPQVSEYTCSYMWISNVTTNGGVSNFNNSSDCAPSSYTDYSSIYNASNYQLATTTMSFTSTNPYDMSYSVWIDFNDNGIFEPAEMVIANGNQNNLLTVTDSFAIPITANPGTHRMRVRGDANWYGAPSDPCNQLVFGETEDYTFTVFSTCTATPNPGNTIATATSVCFNNNFTLSLQNNLSTHGISYQWQKSTDDSTWTNIQGAINDTLTISQTVSTYYRCSVKCMNSQSIGISNPIYIIINPTTCYCKTGLYTNGCNEEDYFTSFNFGTINQTGITCTSGAAGYNDFTSLSTTFTQGSTYSIYGITAYGSDENIRIWIDYNDDGIFDNTSELLYASSSAFGSLTDSITIPLSFISGTHRIRVRLVWSQTSFDACELENYGCVNDYIVNILPLNTSTSKSLHITAMLQEYYNSGTGVMNQTQGIDWDTGNLFNNFGGTVVDTLSIIIRQTNITNLANPCIIDTTFYGRNLNVDGTITPLLLPANITGYHYIVIQQRNSIETWSDSVDFAPNSINYNFNTHISQFAIDGGMYIDASNHAYIWGGDVNQNGSLESEDATEIYVAAISDDETVNNGYVINDIDGNGNIDSQDYGLVYSNALIGANLINPFSYQKKK